MRLLDGTEKEVEKHEWLHVTKEEREWINHEGYLLLLILEELRGIMAAL